MNILLQFLPLKTLKTLSFDQDIKDSDLSLLHCSVKDVYKIPSEVKSRKSRLLDIIHPMILKKCARTLALSLRHATTELEIGWYTFYFVNCLFVSLKKKEITFILRGWHLLLWSILPGGPLYFTSPTEDGTTILRGHPSHAKVSPLALQREWLHSSVILRPWVLVQPWESNILSVKMKSFLCEESMLRHNKRNCFLSYPDHYLTSVSAECWII